MKMLRFLESRHAFFESRYIFWIAALFAVVVSLPTLITGFIADDYQQRVLFLQGNPHDNPYEFFHRGTPQTEANIQGGIVPWWVYPDSKVSFYRPIAHWLMMMDYRLWPDSRMLMHLHSVLWYGLLALAAGLAYRQLMPTRWVAGCAAVLFAVDASHSVAVAWLCNRATMLGFLVSTLALLCYQREKLQWYVLGCALFAISLACGEPALAMSGYFFAYELCLSDRPLARRILRLVPYALVAVGWLAYWKIHGYGTAGPGIYTDPTVEPLQFLQEMMYRMPAYLVGQFLVLPSADFFSAMVITQTLRTIGLVYSWIIVALLFWILTPLLRSSRLARFYGVGLLVSGVLICGQTPVGRSLWFVGFGAIGLLALYIEQFLGRFRALPLSPRLLRVTTPFTTFVVVLHLWVSPLLFITYGQLVGYGDTIVDTHYLHLPDDGPPGKKVLILSTWNYYGSIEYPLLKDRGLAVGSKPSRPPPSITHIVALTEGSEEFVLTRKDADTLLVNATKYIEGGLRSGHYGFNMGDRVVLNEVEMEVLAVTPSRRARMVEYRFKPGVLATYEPIRWNRGKFEPTTLPAIGESVTIKTDYDILNM